MNYSSIAEQAPRFVIKAVLFIALVALLSQLGSAVQHLILSEKVIIRDFIMFLAFPALLYIYISIKHKKGDYIIISLSALNLIFAYAITLTTEHEAAVPFKWTIYWLVSYMFGYIAVRKSCRNYITIFFYLFISYTALLSFFCLYEYNTGSYIMELPNQLTAFGNQLTVSQKLGTSSGDEVIRVRGFERDVFSAASMVSTGYIISLGLFIVAKNFGARLLFFILAIVNLIALLCSGGRSQLYGIFFSTVLFFIILFRIHTVAVILSYIFAILLFALLFTTYGIGTSVEIINKTLNIDSRIFNTMSAFMRDDVWAQLQDAQNHSLVHILFGAIVDNARFDDYLIAIADNNYLWVAYNLGYIILFSLAILLFYISKDLATHHHSNYTNQSLLIFVYLLGACISREELLFYSSIPFFVLLGCFYASISAPENN